MSTAQSNKAIYDARTLGRPRMLLLGFQHMFAMFGATVLVPALTGLSVSVTLLFAGLGTLLFHFLTKLKVPAFLGSSFAFIGGYAAVVAMGAAQGLDKAASLPYACAGVFFAGLMDLILVLAIGIQYGPGSIAIGKVSLSGLAVAALLGIILNAILPGKDYEFGVKRRADLTVNLGGSTRNPNWREEHPDETKL